MLSVFQKFLIGEENISKRKETLAQKERRWAIDHPGENLGVMTTRRRGFWGHQDRLSRENPELFAGLGVHHQEDPAQTDHKQTNLPENAKLKELRRIIKNHWNDWVYNKRSEFLEFWNAEDSPILIVHWVGLLSKQSPREFLENLEQYIERRNQTGKKPDLSCVGYKEFDGVPWKLDGEWNEAQIKKIAPYSPVGLLYNERSIHWASYTDAWTENISSAGEKELAYYQNSSLPKRPSLPVSPHFITIAPEDLTLGETLGEVIISNYQWNTAVIWKSWCSRFDVNPNDIVDIFENNNIEYIIK